MTQNVELCFLLPERVWRVQRRGKAAAWFGTGKGAGNSDRAREIGLQAADCQRVSRGVTQKIKSVFSPLERLPGCGLP